jgi:hypothetical protein
LPGRGLWVGNLVSTRSLSVRIFTLYRQCFIGSSTSFTLQWNPDLLQGVITIKGRWDDGSGLLAIPNYARANRLKEVDEEDGDRSREITSKVWIKESRD